MPRRNVVSRSAPRADASSAEPRRTPVEGMRVRRMMTTGVVDRLPRPRKTDEPEERRTGAVRRLSRRGGAIDRQASFKPPERADPSGLRDAGVEVHVGGAAASTTQTSSPGASDEVVTIQRPASELRGPASAAVTDDTAEMRVEDLMLPVVDEDEATRERKLPKGE